MTATVSAINERTGSAASMVRKTIDLLRAYRDLSVDVAFADAVQMDRSRVQRLTNGRTALTVDVLALFAEVLDVDLYVLSMDPDDAMKWVIDHRPNGPGGLGDSPRA